MSFKDLLELPRNIRKLVDHMADISPLLNEVAESLRGGLSTSIQAILEENAALRATNAELSGEDVAESEAAANVKAAFDEVASKFTAAPEAPDVEPLPLPDEPAPA